MEIPKQPMVLLKLYGTLLELMQTLLLNTRPTQTSSYKNKKIPPIPLWSSNFFFQEYILSDMKIEM